MVSFFAPCKTLIYDSGNNNSSTTLHHYKYCTVFCNGSIQQCKLVVDIKKCVDIVAMHIGGWYKEMRWYWQIQVCLHKIGACLLGKLTICIDNAGPLWELNCSNGLEIWAASKSLDMYFHMYGYGYLTEKICIPKIKPFTDCQDQRIQLVKKRQLALTKSPIKL